jgi:hypothetical protein
MLRYWLVLLFAAALAAQPRVVVSSDIGGTDPDDFQSMVHLLLYADQFDLEGILSSPPGPGRLQHILHVIDGYERDYPNLKTWSARYPTPAALRAISKQGETERAGFAGTGAPTDGSRWLIQCARHADARPLHVLVWGGLEDLAQALHDAPDILPKLRVYFIGGPNKMWSVDAYNYIEQNHPKLWMIEANSTYRGWFAGGNQAGEWGNAAFVAAHVKGHGALGDFFADLLGATIKMGDSPSVGWLLHGDPTDPSKPGWGGRFVRVWDGRKTTFTRMTTAADRAEAFGVTEFALPAGGEVLFDGRIPAMVSRDGAFRFRFSPRDAKVWPYAVDGKAGAFTAAPARGGKASERLANWWVDDPDPAAAEGVHAGAKHVNRWREEYLADFARRLERARSPRGK